MGGDMPGYDTVQRCPLADEQPSSVIQSFAAPHNRRLIGTARDRHGAADQHMMPVVFLEEIGECRLAAARKGSPQLGSQRDQDVGHVKRLTGERRQRRNRVTQRRGRSGRLEIDVQPDADQVALVDALAEQSRKLAAVAVYVIGPFELYDWRMHRHSRS